MKLYSVNHGYFKLDGGAMFGVVPKSIWNGLNPGDENNMCSWALRSLLIEQGDKLILVDTGMGDKQSDKFFGYYYLHGNDSLDKSLAGYGFDRNDITDVFLTHLHFDHCGGAIRLEGEKLVPAFQKAKFWSNEAHWKWATEPNAREKASFLKENILPIQASGRLQFVAGRSTQPNQLDRASFLPNMQILFVDGHTDAMMLPMLQYKGRTIVFMADLLPSIGHIPLPYVMAYDTRPLITLSEKQAFLQEAVDEDYILFFEHDPVNECCTLQQTDRGIRVKEIFRLDEI
ncbi:MAG TPA: MBL fold metallo-hydrolase [Niabella sp.]|nr:MBL fold metallo-hydrolase [Niabella sp.]HOZ96149.1 MBL fold metallo-hydrolase [Niabella sp.]HQW13515.1 MBL fold metallo-hydrolase [Niabella sp.]HQX18909.1 MBL fold metallo-hydrolase [Niabella sp.]HQX41803.1 MBL fold metallo-hydrolase [Niabella sp.]